jgi:uridine phosphorylase
MRKEPHFTPEKLLAVLGVKAGSLAPLALVPGPKDRSDKILGLLDEPKRAFSFLDYEMHTGRRNGKTVTVGNGGRYAADSAMTTEMLCAAGVESLIRVGTCGSLQKKIKIGDIIIVTGAIRGEGTTPYYVPKNFSTVSHPEIVRALAEAAKQLKVRYHLGWVYTTDALFQETPELIQELEGRAISGIDMVTSAFLTIAQVRNKKAGAILAVSDECLNGSIGFRHPRFLKAEDVMVDIVLKAVDLL